MVVAKFDGLVDCCENGSGLEQVVFDSEFCEVEMVDWGFYFSTTSLIFWAKSATFWRWSYWIFVGSGVVAVWDLI